MKSKPRKTFADHLPSISLPIFSFIREGTNRCGGISGWEIDSAFMRETHRFARRPSRRQCSIELLETRDLLAAGIIELGASDNIALDQPRVAVEFAKDIDPGPGVQWESIGPGLFNTFLLDTGASSVLTMASAIADIEQSRLGYEVQGALMETGVAGEHLLDVSIDYRFDFAGSNGIRYTMETARVMSDAKKDFSSFGPWGLVGMPAMEGRVTSLDFTGWSGGGLDLDTIYMDTEFREDVPVDAGHRYTISLDNRLAFDPVDQMVFGQPPIWGDVPFVTGIPEHKGVAQPGNFLFDTGAQISLISKRLAIAIGLDSNGDGLVDQNDENFVTQQVVGGVGGQIAVPVFGFDEFHLPTDSGESLVWTNLEWLVLDIDIPSSEVTLDGVFGSDLLTSGWFHAFFSPGQPDGYINQVHMDFREMPINGTSKVHFDLNPDVDNVILPGPGIIVRESFRTTDVGEGGAADSYDIVLTGAPTDDVIITLANPDGQVTAVNAADGSDQLVYTPSNWETVQTVLVKAVNDVAAEGNHTTLISHTVTSTDSGYDGRTVQDVKVRITDDDLNLLKITNDSAGLLPVESMEAFEGGETVYYWVALSEKPKAETWVVMEDPALQATAAKADNAQLGLENVLMYNVANWDRPQRVSLKANQDAIKEGPHETRIVHTVLDVENFSDPILGATPLLIAITDDDLGVVTITPSGDDTTISEAGDTDTYEIALNMLPSGAVEITLQADDQSQISIDGGFTFAPSRVITLSDLAPKTITIRAIDDAVAEGTHFSNITHSVTGNVIDSRFPEDIKIDSITASILDNDAAGLNFSSTTSSASSTNAASTQNTSTNVTIELIEAGGEAAYAVTLTSKPQADVVVFLASIDGQTVAFDAAKPANAFLTFTRDNWDQPQTVLCRAEDDTEIEGFHNSQLVHTTVSGDPNYQGNLMLPIMITDNDLAEFGDAPAPYPTRVADGGAYHIAVGPRLGANRDAEVDGMAAANADGDDELGLRDEDGVQFGGIQVANSMAAVNILLENAERGKVDAWIDFDRDGKWEASEKILNSVEVTNSIQTLNYQLPADLTTGTTFARVRLSSDGNADPTGPSSDGEVEDYLVHIVSPPTIESVVLNHGDPQRSLVNVVTVTFDRLVEADNQAFEIVERDTGQKVQAVEVKASQSLDRTVIDLTFSPGPLITNFGSLIDGKYRLTIDASGINHHGVLLDGNNDGTAGDDFVFGENPADNFFRKYGDHNGNGAVDLLDFAEFRKSFGSTQEDANFAAELDFEGDGVISLGDFANFRKNFGQ